MLMLCLLLNSYLVFLFLGMISGFHLVVNPVVYFHEGIHSWMKASLDCNDDDDDDTPTFSSSWVFFFRCYEVFFLNHGNNSSFQLPFVVFQVVWCCWTGHCSFFFSFSGDNLRFPKGSLWNWYLKLQWKAFFEWLLHNKAREDVSGGHETACRLILNLWK